MKKAIILSIVFSLFLLTALSNSNFVSAAGYCGNNICETWEGEGKCNCATDCGTPCCESPCYLYMGGCRCDECGTDSDCPPYLGGPLGNTCYYNGQCIQDAHGNTCGYVSTDTCSSCENCGTSGCIVQPGRGCLTIECPADKCEGSGSTLKYVDYPDVCNGYCDAAGNCGTCTCTSTTTYCDDNNPCTIDSCTAAVGCSRVNAVDGTSCPDDGNPCTSDYCSAGTCQHPTLADGTSCGTCKTCQSGSCTTTSCPDTDLCTTDYCSNDVCYNTPRDCEDYNPCTSNYCQSGVCFTIPIEPCCGNGVCEWIEGETCSSCPAECGPCVGDSCSYSPACSDTADWRCADSNTIETYTRTTACNGGCTSWTYQSSRDCPGEILCIDPDGAEGVDASCGDRIYFRPFNYWGDQSYFNVFWNVSYASGSSRDVAMKCVLNCPTTPANLAEVDNCANSGQGQKCIPYPYSQSPGGGSCTVPNPIYRYAVQNEIICVAYDPLNTDYQTMSG